MVFSLKDRQGRWRRLARVGFCLLAAAVLAEVGDRVYLAWLASDETVIKFGTLEQIRARGITRRYLPHRSLGYIPTPSWSEGRDRHNSLGFRGAEIAIRKPPGVYRIACLGGSTTYGNKVDDPQDAFPGALEAELRSRGKSVEVINGACPGWTSLQSLINLQARVLDLSPDLVIVYHGFNDVHRRLVWPPAAYLRDQSGHAVTPWPTCRWWELSSALRTISVSIGHSQPLASLSRVFGSPPATSWSIEFWRQTRDGTYPRGFFRETSAAKMLDANAPTHMEANLRDIATLARAHGAEVALATWAFRPDNPTGDDPRLATPEYQAAIAEQNAMIRRLAAELGAKLWDLAAADLPPEFFVDGSHFNAAGNRHRAVLLADLVEGDPAGGPVGGSDSNRR